MATCMDGADAFRLLLDRLETAAVEHSATCDRVFSAETKVERLVAEIESVKDDNADLRSKIFDLEAELNRLPIGATTVEE